MFGYLECSCPVAVKLFKKYDWAFHLGGHRVTSIGVIKKRNTVRMAMN